MSEPNKDILEIKLIETVTSLMDNAFRVPGTKFKFGIDPILNLIPIPALGSIIGYSVSSLLVLGMVRNGASSGLAAKMVFNVIIDAVIGAVPILGTIWDFGNKANTRNLNLMKEHYQEGKHSGSVLPVLIVVSITFVIILIGLIVGLSYAVSYLWKFFVNLIN